MKSSHTQHENILLLFTRGAGLVSCFSDYRYTGGSVKSHIDICGCFYCYSDHYCIAAKTGKEMVPSQFQQKLHDEPRVCGRQEKAILILFND